MSEVFSTERYFIVNASADDIPYVMEMERKEENRDYVFQNSFEEHKALISSSHEMVFIALEKDSLEKVGFIICEHDKHSDVFELRRIVVESKNKGSGKELVIGLFGYAFDIIKVNRLWLDVFSDNHRAIHLYEMLGMTHEGTLRQGYKDYKGLYRDQMIYSILKSEYEDKSNKL